MDFQFNPTHPASTPIGPGYSMLRNLSTSSLHSIASILSNASASNLPAADVEVEVVKEDGLKHAKTILEARSYKKPVFAAKLLDILRHVHAPTWNHEEITADDIKVFKVSGSLTNAVFFVSCPSLPEIRTMLLRIYGPSSGNLISRPRELHTLHILSSKYHIGPRVYGTFENGRIEEYFESTTLVASDLRDPEISRWIGSRMAELHSVALDVSEEPEALAEGEGLGWELAAKKNFRSWLGPASEVLSLPNISSDVRETFNLEGLSDEWEGYMKWLSTKDDVLKGSRRVFSHNDTQYGNLLRIRNVKKGAPAHHQIIVVDFEYAAPNPASFDIANHFHEWTADYSSPETPHLLQPGCYPTLEERRNFYKSYIFQSTGKAATEEDLANLDEQVRIWSPAVHAIWTIWGIVQAREDVEAGVEAPEFDNIGYSLCRAALFRQELSALGL